MGYKYIWIAKLFDGTQIKQFEDDGTENNFGAVLRNVDNIREFCLIDIDKGIEKYSVDLDTGDITNIGVGKLFKSPFDLKNTCISRKPIFWRRSQLDMFGPTHGMKRVVGYIFGWQALMPHDNNVVIQFLETEDGIVPLDKLGRKIMNKEISSRASIVK